MVQIKPINENTSFSELQTYVDEYPYIFRIAISDSYKKDELEKIFDNKFPYSKTDFERISIVNEIHNKAKIMYSELNNKHAVEQAKRLLESSCIPLSRQNDSFETYKPVSDILNNAKKLAMSYIQNTENIKNGKNLIIAGFGDVGTGKTHLAISIAKEAIKKQIPALFVNSTTMMQQLKKDFDIKPYVDTELLICDDLGKENKTSWVLEQLYLILDTRHNNRKSTVITTENTLDYLEAQFGSSGKALISRICFNYTLIKCTGEDYRLNSQKHF